MNNKTFFRAKLRYFFFGTLFSAIFVFVPLLLLTLLQTLPNPATLGQQQFPQTTKIYDRNHHLLYQIYANQNRTLVSLNDIPLFLQQATIATEDKNFYKNPGFDIVAIIRAGLSDLTRHNFQGGSTLTQQLVKSALLTPDITLARKLQEVVLALWTEHLYSKQQILTMYFNQVPYGGTAWGVEAASQTYFGKDVAELDLAQSAFLAGLPQAPTRYSPFGEYPTLWKQRQQEVLSHMLGLGYITKQQYQDAQREQLTFNHQQPPILAPHFVMYIKNLLEEKYGINMVEKGGLSVITTLDSSLQQAAQQIVSREVAKDSALDLSNGAALVTNPQNGDILAMVGSTDYNQPDWGNVNLTTSLRQPGSSIKIVTYAAALSHGYTPATPIDDSPISFPDGVNTYTPVNYDGKFHGIVSLRTAFANSFNIPAVKVLNNIGIDTFVSLGRKMGLSHLQDANDYGLSVTLGSAEVTMLDMATTYGTVANNGARVDLNPILSVSDYKGNILEKKQPVKQQIIDPSVAFLLSDILSDNTARSWEFGTNSPLFIPGHRVSVKTGTTDNKRDNWTIGYTPNYVTTVWVGNNDNTPMSQDLASGITGAAPIWHDITSTLVDTSPNPPLAIPNSVVSKSCLGRQEFFVRGTENSVSCVIARPPITPTTQP